MNILWGGGAGGDEMNLNVSSLSPDIHKVA